MQWLNANRISLNVAKTEVVVFRRKKKQLGRSEFKTMWTKT